MRKIVTIVDYGMSNILSLARAFEYCDTSVNVTNSADQIQGASYLVLPGVGAFYQGMKNLEKERIVDPIKKHISTGKPFLGVCLGMQMMLEIGCEVREYAGLAVIEGRVEPLPAEKKNGVQNKIPNIGWGRLVPAGAGEDDGWGGTVLQGIYPESYVYFVHSFQAIPMKEDNVVAKTEFGDRFFVSVVNRENAIGVQFHPEKSGEIGLDILRNFLSI